LNLTSRKKRNTMLAYSNTTPSGASQTTTVSPLYVTGATGALCLWNATAQSLYTASNYNTVVDQSARTATTCYMVGLSERLRIQTSSGLPWFWRRICFTTKGEFPSVTSPSPINPETYYVDTSNGINRLWLNLNINNSSNALAALQGILFRGQQGKDWDDYLTAPVDPTRVTKKYDRTVTFRSGNALGIVREPKLYHPMNANLVYDDDENGDAEQTSAYSTDSKMGMGDYFVLDIILPGTGGSATDLLQLRSTSTLYWHEK